MPTDDRAQQAVSRELAAPWRVRAARMLEFRPRETVALALAGALVLAGAMVSFARSRPVPLSAPHGVAPAGASAATPSAEPSTLYVHVAGEVRRPGVYAFAQGARVVDAVRSAGGATRRADLDAINLARPLGDGERVVVPREGQAPAQPGGEPDGTGAASDEDKVNINLATQAQLEELPGVGPVLAERIVQYREQHGPFRAVRDLLKVEGIGPKKFATLEPHVTV